MPSLYQRCYTTYMHAVSDLVNDETIKDLASPADYQAGRQIADNDGVDFTEFTPLKVSAFVQPTSSLMRTAILEASDEGLTWHCTCASHEARFCEHLVATALETAKKSPQIH